MVVAKKKSQEKIKNLRRDLHLKIKGLDPKLFIEAVDSYAEIRNMKVGSSGYISAYGLIATHGDDVYLNTNVSLEDKSDDACVKITRITAHPNGFAVHLGDLTKRNYGNIHRPPTIEDYTYHMSREFEKNVVKLGNIGPLLEIIRKGKK
ncbi:MAG: hypothetical protein KGH71_00405 [Candidatus Micrarchaeota archaeon]|nr:hypothetical protein [Candidatus Micrarchaeota archaeon]